MDGELIQVCAMAVRVVGPPGAILNGNRPPADIHAFQAARCGSDPHRSSRLNGRSSAMAYDKQQVIDFLRHMGYSQAADDAARELPSRVSLEQVWEFNDRHRIILDELTDWMGGSPLAVTQPSSLRGRRTAAGRASERLPFSPFSAARCEVNGIIERSRTASNWSAHDTREEPAG
jgi:hypothetical protein